MKRDVEKALLWLYNSDIIVSSDLNVFVFRPLHRTMSAKRKNTPIKYSTDEHDSLTHHHHHQHIDNALAAQQHDNMDSDDTAFNDVSAHLMTQRQESDSHQACDASLDSDGYSERSNSPRDDVSMEHARDSDSPGSDTGRPRSKKQRLLASLHHDGSASRSAYHGSHRYSPYAPRSPPQQPSHIELNLINNNLKTAAVTSSVAAENNTTNQTHSEMSSHSNRSDDDVTDAEADLKRINDVNINIIQRLQSSIDSGDGSVDVDTHVKKGINSIIESGESVAEKQRRFDAMILQIQTLKETLGRENDLKVGAKTLPLTHVTSFVSSRMLPLYCYVVVG